VWRQPPDFPEQIGQEPVDKYHSLSKIVTTFYTGKGHLPRRKWTLIMVTLTNRRSLVYSRGEVFNAKVP